MAQNHYDVAVLGAGIVGVCSALWLQRDGHRVALVDLVVRFSELVVALRDPVAEIDLNPVIVNQRGCTIVDALVIPQQIESI